MNADKRGFERIGSWPANSWTLVAWGHIARWMSRTFAKEVLFHLLEQEFLGLRISEVETVFVHDHLHLLDPHFPGVLGDVFVDALAEWMPVEGYLIESGQLLLQFDAEHDSFRLVSRNIARTHFDPPQSDVGMPSLRDKLCPTSGLGF